MPTENRPSNTEMVSVPPYIGLEPLVGRYYPAQCRRCGWVGSSEELTEDDAQCTRDVGDRLCLGDCDELERHDLLNIIQAMATPQPHPEPIAWMVGTAIWWTKEEAERDAAATGLPVIPVGPMVDTAEIERQKSRADTNALNHRHAKNAIGDIKAYVERLVAASSGQPSVATGYLSDIVAFIVERTKGDPTETSGINALRLELQESRRNEFKMHALMREKDQVLSAVQGQFKRYGERFPDGFDGRLFRWVDDAVSSASAQPEVTS